jgi:hypothetical protein
MSSEEKVRAKHPHAEARFVRMTKGMVGQQSPTPAYWWIANQPGLGATELGRGNSEPSAWHNAARDLNPPPAKQS